MRLNSEDRCQIFAAVLKVFDRSRMLTSKCVVSRKPAKNSLFGCVGNWLLMA